MADTGVEPCRSSGSSLFSTRQRVADGRDILPPLRKAAAVAIVDNPVAGRFVEGPFVR